MHVMDLCASEQSLRCPALHLYPSVPVNTRTVVRTTILPTGGGPDRKSPVVIRKGTSVAFIVYALHRRPELYGMDAEIFRPERWDEDMPLNRVNCHSVTGQGFVLEVSRRPGPFGGREHSCITNSTKVDFALTEAAYTIVHIL